MLTRFDWGVERNGSLERKILLAIRDGTRTLRGLYSFFGLDPDRHGGTLHSILRFALLELERAGLVDRATTHGQSELGPERGWLVEIDQEWQLTPAWSKAQAVLGLSLRELAFFDASKDLAVRPFFGIPEQTEPFDIFVAMPFRSELQPVYEDHIKNAARSLNLSVKRGDDFFTANTIIADIWKALWASRVVVADCTGRNPNVFYEIGMAHSIGREVILITQNEDDVPFDLKSVRYIKYEYTPRGMQQFEKTLTQTLEVVFPRESAIARGYW
jgi:hypothetical protein